MILTQKLTNMAYALHDGRARAKKDLNANQAAMALSKVPTLLEFFGHVFFFPGFLAGPVHQLRDYLDFIHGVMLRMPCYAAVLRLLDRARCYYSAFVLSPDWQYRCPKPAAC